MTSVESFLSRFSKFSPKPCVFKTHMHRSAQGMSRAQYHQNSPAVAAHPLNVVNGGLIDFQDNLQRGVQEYVTPTMIMHQQQGGFGQSPYQQLASLASQQGVNQFTAGQIQPGQMLCGPASFLHVNGVTYKPVDEPSTKLTPAPDKPSPAAMNQESGGGAASSSQGPRALSERELREAIDKRVKQQVMSYVRNQHDGVGGGAWRNCSRQRMWRLARCLT